LLRTSEALEAINEAEALAERLEQCDYNAELHRLRGVFLTALGAEETQIEASFCEAIRVAQEQKSCSLEKRAKGTYAEYRRQKASRSDQEDVDSDYLFHSFLAVPCLPPPGNSWILRNSPAALPDGSNQLVRAKGEQTSNV
jgi:hypothetical protein